MWREISQSINSLSKHNESIKIYFSNCPWDEVAILAQVLKAQVDLENPEAFYKLQKSLSNDLDVLENMIEEIMTVVEIIKPGVIKTSHKSNSAYGLYQKLMNEEQMANKKKPVFCSSYNDKFLHLKKITEPELDLNSKRKLIKLLECAEIFDANSFEGRAALFAVSLIIGEETKGFSDQLKALNTEINFSALKRFRDKVHDIDEKPEEMRGIKLLNFLSNIISIKYFDDLKDYLSKELKIQVNSLKVDAYVVSNVIQELPAKYDTENIDKIIDIIRSIIPQLNHQDKIISVNEKLELLSQVLGRKLLVPKGFDQYKFIYQLFQDEFQESNHNMSSNYEKLIEAKINRRDSSDIGADRKERAVANKNDIDCLKKFLHKPKPSSSTQNVTLQEIDCLNKIIAEIGAQNISEQFTSREKYFSDLLLKSLEMAVENTESIIKNANGNMKIARGEHDSSQVQYFHLFCLILVGQSIHNLFTIEHFSSRASCELLAELDFMKWVRNGLMHSQAVEELGSTFSYFRNDLLVQKIEEDPIRTYDSAHYLSRIRTEFQNILEKTDTKQDDTKIGHHYSTLIIKRLELAYAKGNTLAEHLIINTLEIDQKFRLKKDNNFDNNGSIDCVKDSDGNTYYNITPAGTLFSKSTVEKVYNLEEWQKQMTLQGEFALLATNLDNSLNSLRICKLLDITENTHDIAGNLLAQTSNIYVNSLSTNVLYNNKKEIYDLCSKYTIILFCFTTVSNDHKKTLGFFIQDDISELAFAEFKQKLKDIVKYRFKVLNQAHLYEYNNKVDTEEKIIIDQTNTFVSIIKSIELSLALQKKEPIENIIEILEKDCNLDFECEGYTPLQRAYCCYDDIKEEATNIEIITLLLDKGANVNFQDKRGDTLAHYLAEVGNLALLKKIKEYGAKFDIKNNECYGALTPLEVSAIRNNSIEAYEYLSQYTSLPPVERLIQAIRVNNLAAVEECLQHIDKELLNFPIETRGSEHKELIFHFACAKCNVDLLKLLIDRGCDPKLKDSNGRTGLYMVFESEDNTNETIIETANYLINTCELQLQDSHNNDDCSLLLNAILSRKNKVAEYLYDKNIDPNYGHIGGFSTLLHILNNPRLNVYYIEVIKKLLEKGANVLETDGYVGNALHLAAEKGHTEVIDILIKHARTQGVLENLLAPSPDNCCICGGKTAYEIAREYGHEDLAEKLLEYFIDRETISGLEYIINWIENIFCCGQEIYHHGSSSQDVKEEDVDCESTDFY